MRHERIIVKRDTQTTHNLWMAPWEIPLLEWTFDSGNVTRLGEFKMLEKREYPEPAAEYERLVKVYGVDPKSDVAHVASVYGQAGAGVRALKAAIDEAKAEEKAAAGAHKPRAKAKSREARIQEILADPLLS